MGSSRRIGTRGDTSAFDEFRPLDDLRRILGVLKYIAAQDTWRQPCQPKSKVGSHSKCYFSMMSRLLKRGSICSLLDRRPSDSAE